MDNDRTPDINLVEDLIRFASLKGSHEFTVILKFSERISEYCRLITIRQSRNQGYVHK